MCVEALFCQIRSHIVNILVPVQCITVNYVIHSLCCSSSTWQYDVFTHFSWRNSNTTYCTKSQFTTCLASRTFKLVTNPPDWQGKKNWTGMPLHCLTKIQCDQLKKINLVTFNTLSPRKKQVCSIICLVSFATCEL